MLMRGTNSIKHIFMDETVLKHVKTHKSFVGGLDWKFCARYHPCCAQDKSIPEI